MSDPHFDVSSVCGKISWKMVQCHVNILEFISCVCLSRGSMGTEKSWPQRVATTAQRNDTVERGWQKTTVLKDDICNTYTRWNKTALRKERKTSIDFFFFCNFTIVSSGAFFCFPAENHWPLKPLVTFCILFSFLKLHAADWLWIRRRDEVRQE